MTPIDTDVVGIGNAIVDILTHTTDAELERLGAVKGSMTLIDAVAAADLHRSMRDTLECSGGSAANTMVGLASLGSRSAYIGRVRDDRIGEVFRRDLRAAGVVFDTPAAEEGPPSGRCLIWVTPDAQRTMQTLLGASAGLSPEDIDPRAIESARVTYLEGYLFDPPPAKRAFREASEIAHRAGRRVALSLSDSFCVERHREEFRDLVAGHVDVVFANETEITSLFEVEDFRESIPPLRARCQMAVITRGADGSVVVTPEQVIEVAAETVDEVVDTTGAGDLFAAGFIHGLVEGRDLATCARIGSIAAAEVISHVGARPAASLRELVAARLPR